MKNTPQRIATILISLVVIVATVVLVWRSLMPGAPHLAAQVSVQGQSVCVIDLVPGSAARVIDLMPLAGVNIHLEVSEGAIRVLSSDCPDQICVRALWLRHELDMAVCMPNRTVITLIRADEQTTQSPKSK